MKSFEKQRNMSAPRTGSKMNQSNKNMMSIKEQFSYDFHGMTLNEMVRNYSSKNIMSEGFGISGYKVPL